MEKSTAKLKVIKAGTELVRTGLIARTWGNVSCRVDKKTFVITPSGRDYLSLTEDEIVEVNIDNLSYHSKIKPSSEKGLHAAVYQLYPNINFVIHTHQENASAISAAGLDFINLSKQYKGLGKKIVCAKYALPGTKLLRKNVIKALTLSDSNVLILKHHGVLCFGEDYESTFETAHQLEAACEDYINERYKSQKQNIFNNIKNESNEINEFNNLCELMKLKEGFIILNRDSDVVQFSHLGTELKPFLDDFAQIVGTRAETVENNKLLINKALDKSSAVFIKDIGAICWGKNENDAYAVKVITSKNCKAYFTAALFRKPKPIKSIECALMRYVYLKKYSTLSYIK